MGVSTTIRKNIFNGNGIVKDFTFTFKVVDSGQLKLLKTDASGVTTNITENFTVSNITEDGGFVEYPDNDDDTLIIQEGETLTIYREVEKTQNFIRLNIEDSFNSENVENAIDTLVMRDQELQEELDRCLKIGIDSEQSFDDYINTIQDAARTSGVNKDEVQTIYDNTQLLYQNIEDIYDIMPPHNLSIDNAGKIPIISPDGTHYDLTDNDAPVFVYLDGTEINWKLGRYFSKTLTESTTITFVNVGEYSKEINVAITEPSTGAYTLTFPTGIRWDGGSAPTQTANATDLYQFISINGVVYGKRICANMAASAFPYGIDGDLTINNGETVDISAGSTKDYNNLTINTGGKLRVTGNSVNFTIIGCAGNLTLAGTIEAKNSTAVGTASTTAGDGTVLSRTTTQAAGGAGGTGAGYLDLTQPEPPVTYADGRLGQPSSNGEGGGGASGCCVVRTYGQDAIWGLSPSVNGTSSPLGGGNGLNGGNASCSYGSTTVGTGGTTYYTNSIRYKGANGVSAGPREYNTAASGGGGGGGGKGLHGKNLYIRVKGTFNGTGGVIDISGGNGGNGGNAGNGAYYRYQYSGNWEMMGGGSGGGGGAAGGNGGKVVIRHASAAYTAPTIIKTGGTGGTGGTKSNSVFYDMTQPTWSTLSTNGGNGSNGTAGVEDVAVYV